MEGRGAIGREKGERDRESVGGGQGGGELTIK